MRVIPWISVATCHITTKSIYAVVRFLTDALHRRSSAEACCQIDVTLCVAQEWNIPWQDPRIAANALRDKPHPPSSTVPLPHRGRLKQDPRKMPVGLDLIRRLRRSPDGALLLVPVGASP